MKLLNLFFFLTTLWITKMELAAQTIPWFATEKLTDAHDPTIILDERGVYTLLTTNNMLAVRQSTDMVTWTKVGNIFSGMPAWVNTALNATIPDIWAPHIAFRDGKYWVYYTGSSFGTNNSVIGVVSSPTLDTKASNYKWTDLGQVIKTSTSNDYNAIDAELVVDLDNKVWMMLGSWWTGIKMVAIDPATGKRLASNNTVYPLANRGGSGIEGPSFIQHNGFYYLFTSWDVCCNGTSATYRTMVGRSNSITGTYVDKQNKSLANNASVELLKGYGRYYGPGGGSPFKVGRRDYYAHHYYNGNENGAPRLQIREIVYDDSNWPILTQPFLGRRQSFEAEHAILTNAQINTGTNASNKEYVGGIDAVDSKVVFHINVLSAGDYLLRIRYATSETSASHFVQVNTAAKVEIKYTKNASGQFPQGQSVNPLITLKEGYNSITFTKGTGIAELDRIDLIRGATSKLEGGSYDNFINCVYKSTGNNGQLGAGGWIMFENIDFGSGGLKNLALAMGTAGSAQFRLNIDGINSATNTTFTTNTSSKVQNFTLPTALQSITGIHDVYLTQVSGNVELDYLQFGIDIVTGLGEKQSAEIAEIFPNPVQNQFTIRVKGNFSYSILNESGISVSSGEGQGQKIVSTDFPKGVYLIKISSDEGNNVQKLIKTD